MPEVANAAQEKWGGALDGGFQVVPNVLLKSQRKLGLDCVDCVILLNLSLHWWSKDRLPFPQPSVIAKRIGVSRRTVERRIVTLEKRGWIKRLPAEGGIGTPKVRKFAMTGIAEKLSDAARIGLARREYKASQEKKRHLSTGRSVQKLLAAKSEHK